MFALSSSAASARSMILEVREKMLMLNEEDQTLISLKFFEDLSYAEMAKIMGKREGTLRVRLHRAVQALKKEMGGEEDE